MIPKRIFYVWGYGERKSKVADICIENWRVLMPDFEIIEINEKSKDWFDFDYEYENNLWFKTVYDLKMWAYVSDYMRVKTLYDHGGVYLDTDVTAYKNFTPLLNDKMFIGNTPINLPDPCVMGAETKHPVLRAMYDFYQSQIWKSDKYVITHIFKKVFNNLYGEKLNKDRAFYSENLVIYPYQYFTPSYYAEEFTHKAIKEDTYSMHWQGNSWVTKKNLYFLSNKHKIPLKALLKQLEFIEKTDMKANDKIEMKVILEN